eukprot:TRINITY_DN4920_c0_g1_i4.p2 TRINITY_DN4920_c0_g1~~TRINITY_DN4920_c0_g1_i4.p2  ORF type:complete len:133 (+),score=20.86 TRINITY_DN4920_c0_g1_i4:94-492(+)
MCIRDRASFKQNLDPEGVITNDQIEKILESTGFQIRGVNKQLPQEQQESLQQSDTENMVVNVKNESEINLEFRVEKSGSNLSNGEKQVINFLRILLQNVDIVCLDEATSNMDPDTDAKLHKRLFEYLSLIHI